MTSEHKFLLSLACLELLDLTWCIQGEHTHAAPPLLHQHSVRSSHARRSTGLVRLS